MRLSNSGGHQITRNGHQATAVALGLLLGLAGCGEYCRSLFEVVPVSLMLSWVTVATVLRRWPSPS